MRETRLFFTNNITQRYTDEYNTLRFKLHISNPLGAGLRLDAIPAHKRKGGQVREYLNALEVYKQSGERAGEKRARGAEACATRENDWAQRAFALEVEPYRTKARKAWTDSYRAAFRIAKGWR